MKQLCKVGNVSIVYNIELSKIFNLKKNIIKKLCLTLTSPHKINFVWIMLCWNKYLKYYYFVLMFSPIGLRMFKIDNLSFLTDIYFLIV